MRKAWLLVMCLLLSVSVFANGNAEQGSGSKGEVVLSEPGTFPIVVEGDVTLTGIAPSRPKTDNFEDNGFTRYAENLFNINLDVACINEDEYKQKLNLLMASGDYPDMLLHTKTFLTLAEQQLYADQGILLPLDEYLDTIGVESKKMLSDYPLARDAWKLDDGKVYTMPSVEACYHCQNTSKLWIYQPWLDKLGLDMPATTEEFYEVLVAFKTQDPNGNGIADEIPMMGSYRGWDTQVELFLMNAFAYTDGGKYQKERLYIEDGKVMASYVTPGWQEGLKFFNRLIEEGLLAPESFTQDDAQLKKIGENPDAVILGCAPGGSMGTFTKINGESGRWLEYTTVPPLKGPSGVQFTNLKPFVKYRANIHITDSCEYPEVAFRFADAFLNTEVMMHNIYGEEGKEWDWAQEGDKGLVDGFPGVYRELYPMQDKPQNSTWEQVGPRYRTTEFRLGRVTDSPTERILYEETKYKYEPHFPDVDMIIPPMLFPQEEAAEMVDLQTTIKTYVEEMFARFTIGDADVDEDWDDYVKEIETMGLDRLLEIYQTAYDKR